MPAVAPLELAAAAVLDQLHDGVRAAAAVRQGYGFGARPHLSAGGLQRRRPHLHALIVGSDVVAYGATRSDGRSWGQWARTELPLDPSRTHWLGALQEADYHAVLAASDVHLYLTVPFVLSWSLLEAMAAGCALVSSATPPVQEVLRHGSSALLVDFFAVERQVEALQRLLVDPPLRVRLAGAAQAAAAAFDWRVGLAGSKVCAVS